MHNSIILDYIINCHNVLLEESIANTLPYKGGMMEKIKIPLSVPIAGKTYSVKSHRSKSYGMGRLDLQEIKIGNLGSDEQTLDNYLHEVIEIYLMEKLFRYSASNNNFLYIMTHDQLQGFIADLGPIVIQLMKLNKSGTGDISDKKCNSHK